MATTLKTEIGVYEQHCIEYALYGDPERDHWDYEEAAQYDRWDGHRMDAACEDGDDGLPVDPDQAWCTELWFEALAEENWARAWADAADPVPF